MPDFQWKSLLGVTIDPHHKSHTHAGIVDYYIDIFHNITSVRYQDAVLGLVCCAILLSLRVGGQSCKAYLREVFTITKKDPSSASLVGKDSL